MRSNLSWPRAHVQAPYDSNAIGKVINSFKWKYKIGHKNRRRFVTAGNDCVGYDMAVNRGAMTGGHLRCLIESPTTL
eukprot:scaffold19608_cov128-Skeletonema_dohrnii-CCMP3373.AAC.7